jgi:argininosuccinate synthase
MSRIVLAFTGSLRTSVAIPWLKERHQAEVVTATFDLGLGHELEAIRDRALATGAARAHVLDLREEFARSFVTPALKAGASVDGRRPMAPRLARPLVAQKLVSIAAMEQTVVVAHGGEPADLDAAVRLLNSKLQVVAPAVEAALSRADQITYLRERGLPVPADADRLLHIDRNLWGRTIVALSADADPGNFTLTRPVAACPEEPAFVEIAFSRGVPVSVNGVSMKLPDLVESLGTIVGAHGVGRIEGHSEGARRVASESPAAVALHTAHAHLEKMAMQPDVHRLSEVVAREYVGMLDAGTWFTPLRDVLDAFVDKAQQPVTGVVRLKLFKGQFTIVHEGSAVTSRRTIAVSRA